MIAKKDVNSGMGSADARQRSVSIAIVLGL